MREKRAVRGRITAIAVIAIAFFAFSDVVTLAQPNIVELRDLIKVSVYPASIPADGVSTSRIEIAVFSPERLGGGPAAHTEIEVSTDLGTLRDAENESNSGSKITLFTNDTAIAVALLSGDEPGKANITVRAPSIEEAINLELGNETTAYIVKNSTTITLLEPEVTPSEATPSPTEVTPSPTPPTPTPSLAPTPSLVPSPSLTPSPTPSLPTPTPPLPGTPYETPTPSAELTPTISPLLTPTATPSPSPTQKPFGFEAVFTIISLFVVAYIVLRRGV